MAKYYITKDVAGTKYYYDKDSQSWQTEISYFKYNIDTQAINFAVMIHNKEDGIMFLFEEKTKEDDKLIVRLIDMKKENEAINKLILKK